MLCELDDRAPLSPRLERGVESLRSEMHELESRDE